MRLRSTRDCSSESRWCTGRWRQSQLTAEQKRLVERTYDIVRASWSPSRRRRRRSGFRRSTSSWPRCSRNFASKVLADENTWTVLEREADLAGLPGSLVSAAKAAADERGLSGKWAIVNTRSSVDPFLTFSTRRDLREKVWKKFKSRGDNGDENDTNATIAKIVKLRAERATLLGYVSPCALAHVRHHGARPESRAGADDEGLAGRRGPREGRSGRHAGDRDEGDATADHDRAVGLPLLRGEGAQGEVRPRTGTAETVLRAEQHGRRRVVVGRAPLRHPLRGDHRQGAGLSSRRARIRSDRCANRCASRPVLPRQLRASGQAFGRLGVQLPDAAQVRRRR